MIQPAAKEVGDTLGRTVRVALAPLRGFVWCFEQIEAYLYEAVTEKLKDIKTENIVSPPLMIAGPAIESMRYAGHEETLREMYASLLATSMDRDTAATAHPSFVEIIRQLTPDEAKLLAHMGPPQDRPFLTLREGIGAADDGEWSTELRHITRYGEQVQLANPSLTQQYLMNLKRLGLVDLVDNAFISTPNAYDDIRNWEPVKNAVDEMQQRGNYPIYVEGYVSITLFGDLFLRACVYPHGTPVAAKSGPPAPADLIRAIPEP